MFITKQQLCFSELISVMVMFFVYSFINDIVTGNIFLFLSGQYFTMVATENSLVVAKLKQFVSLVSKAKTKILIIYFY